MKNHRIWDLFTRIYHFSQLILLAILWYSGEQGDFDLHFLCGYLMLSLFIARIIWGLVGSDTSKFSHFLKSPITAWQWLKRPHQPHTGHNPLAGYMVLALIITLGLQLFSGLFATDDVLAEGPLIYWLSENFAETMDSLHHTNFNVLLGLIALHIIAAVVHSLKADNVIKAIFITGKSTEAPEHKLKFKSSLLPLAIWGAVFLSLNYFWLS
ncbi:cytochrome b/b6 domain-containing protein [Colwellia sp. MEBiC06753]